MESIIKKATVYLALALSMGCVSLPVSQEEQNVLIRGIDFKQLRCNPGNEAEHSHISKKGYVDFSVEVSYEFESPKNADCPLAVYTFLIRETGPISGQLFASILKAEQMEERYIVNRQQKESIIYIS